MRWRIAKWFESIKYPRLTHTIWKQKRDRFGNLEVEGRVIKFFDILGKHK
jgi:hypothetical protein